MPVRIARSVRSTTSAGLFAGAVVSLMLAGCAALPTTPELVAGPTATPVAGPAKPAPKPAAGAGENLAIPEACRSPAPRTAQGEAPDAEETDAPPARIDWDACLAAATEGSGPWVVAQINLGTQAFVTGDIETALGHYVQSVENDRWAASDPALHAFRASLFQEAGREEDAVRDAEAAWAGLRLGSMIPGRTLDDEAQADLLRLILPVLFDGEADAFLPALAAFEEITDFDDEAQFGPLAGLMQQLGQAEYAVELGAKALEAEPDSLTLLNNHCYHLARVGRAAEGLPLCERAVAGLTEESSPGSRSAYLHSLAVALAATGACPRAEVLMAEVRSLTPSFNHAKETLACVTGD
jgi:tetratricopeptide (TPR) repeat protein